MPAGDSALDRGPCGGSGRVLIVGCGASLRRDDQVGLRIAEALAAMGFPETVLVRTTECPGADILADLTGPTDIALLVVVDAAAPVSDRTPGSWRRIDYRRQPQHVGGGDRSNVHALGAEAAFDMAEQMGILPPEVWVYAVAVNEVDYGEEMTPAVGSAVGEVSARIASDVRRWLNAGGRRRA